jgi:hypothetical protein
VLGIATSPAAIGVWRPTPLLNASGAGPQFATMTPWVLKRPSQFRLQYSIVQHIAVWNRSRYAPEIERGATMIRGIEFVGIPVRNQDAALKF